MVEATGFLLAIAEVESSAADTSIQSLDDKSVSQAVYADQVAREQHIYALSCYLLFAGGFGCICALWQMH